MTKRDCVGCRDNFYNGNNPLGVAECWMYKDAKLIPRKEVSIDQRPPWTQEPRLLPNCYSRSRYVYVRPDREN